MSTQHHPVILEALAELDEYYQTIHDELLTWEVLAASTAAIVQELSESDLCFKRPVTFDASWKGGQMHGILVRIEIDDTDVMVEVLRRFRAAGWRIGKPEEYIELKRRSYSLSDASVEKGPVLGHLLFFFPYDEGAKCTFVQTGTKQVPVFELRCKSEEVK